MSTQTHRKTNGRHEHETIENIADDARSLIAATAESAEEKVVSARNKLIAALDAAKETYAVVQDKAIAGAKATDEMIREKPYQAIGIAFAAGALLGFLFSRRSK